MRVVIIGGGIIGASVAWHLSQRGILSTVVEAGAVAGQATGAGFGWINASFHLDETHYRLRAAGMAAWDRVEAALDSGALHRAGCLNWEWEGAELDAHFERFKALGYGVEIVGQDEISQRVPALGAVPERALVFAQEAAVDGAAMTRALLRAAGARVITGVRAEEIETDGGRVTGVRLTAGRLPADAVVVAAGVASGDLVAPLGVDLPMLSRPGLMLRSRPVPPVLSHILVSPRQELRQDAEGRILAPTAANHQCDATETVVERPDALADQAMARLRRMLPGVELDWEEVVLAHRPVPGDGLPVMGPVSGAGGPEGLCLAVMHSGATLAAIAGEMVAGAVTGAADEMMAPYGAARFAGAQGAG